MSRLFLIDPQSDQGVRELAAVDVITAADLANGVYNLSVEYAGGAVGSVRFYIDGQLVGTDNDFPFAAFGELAGDFFDQAMPANGTVRSLSIEVYSGPDGTGTLLESQSFSLTFANTHPLATVDAYGQAPLAQEAADSPFNVVAKAGAAPLAAPEGIKRAPARLEQMAGSALQSVPDVQGLDLAQTEMNPYAAAARAFAGQVTEQAGAPLRQAGEERLAELDQQRPSWIEENMLAEHFGDEYEAYRNTTERQIPFLY